MNKLIEYTKQHPKRVLSTLLILLVILVVQTSLFLYYDLYHYISIQNKFNSLCNESDNITVLLPTPSAAPAPATVKA